ncbi:NADPH-dependent 1-acyldihydroxyacetone phosphate reductase [Golovinomyces cichoracearum]|uniref:NADPH-dependent 1-acyldihydroxyacetone phosphate reductase n=1 Tax=Golovinomyces cichoracearum TaxID=62708 RepID=A0A420HYX4_9PEZI|nr:NADPH-dependent 1-acyldihydroxyacetone phosphate reductase [Golovinomyces cichoracearum]
MSCKNPKKTVLITGCSPGGIGHALALEFYSQGLHVIATARAKEVLADLEELGLSTLELDVNSPTSIQAALSSVREISDGRLDILVNNAGRLYVVPGAEVDLYEARQTFETNFFAVISMTQAFLPLLLESKGLILNIGSVSAIIPLAFGSIYNASKAALHAYSQTLRLELEPFKVKVMVVITGGVKSRIGNNTSILSPNSLYLEIQDSFHRRITYSQENPMPTIVYASDVVKEALKGPKAPNWLWRGNKTFMTWFISRILGSWVFDILVPRTFGLNKLSRIIQEKRKAL